MLTLVSALLAPLTAAIGYSSYKARQFEQAYPNIGELTDIGGYRMNAVHIERPGHGYSERGGPDNALPSGQADAIAALMEKRGIDKAIIVGHSFGGAIAAAFGVRHPDKTEGLLFLA